MKYNINEPWKTLDSWQKDYIENTDPNKNCFLLTGRQVGKTTAMSIKAVELCMKHFKKGDYILICSITEKQGYHLLAKALSYAEAVYPKQIKGGKDRPTKHEIRFKNGTGILSYPAGETGQGLRGFTIKKLMIDEGSRMSDEFFIAVSPQLSVAGGSMDLASTPCGKIGFFYERSMDTSFKKFYVSAEDCPRHSKEFLQSERERLSKLAYAQEYLAIFTDELMRLFSDDLLNKTCVGKRNILIDPHKYYIGVDVAGFGKDENVFAVIGRNHRNKLIQRENIITKKELTTNTALRIQQLTQKYKPKKIGVDDGGVGFGVFSQLLDMKETKRKTIALNNASRDLNKDGTKSKKLLKEEMYMNLLALMEQDKIILLNDDEILASLKSIQYEFIQKENAKTKTRIYGSYSHIAEAIIRAAWLAEKDKTLNIYIY